MENELMTQVLAFSTVIAVVVSCLMEMIKRAVNVPQNWIPVVTFIGGLFIGVVAEPFTDMDIVLRLWAGGIAGWMSSGIYENVKHVKKL